MIPDIKIHDFKIRFAEEKDVSLILQFIKALAEYENLSNQVIATEELLTEFLFRQQKAEVILGIYRDEPVSFALFFSNFSTFLGRPGIYLEDLFVKPELRGMGIGTAMLSFLNKLVEQRGYGRLEWACLDWNEPSIRFYKQLGAEPMDQWTIYRIQKKFD